MISESDAESKTVEPVIVPSPFTRLTVTTFTVLISRSFVSSMKMPTAPVMLAASVVTVVLRCWAAVPAWAPLTRRLVAITSVSVVPLSVMIPVALRLTLPVVLILPTVIVVAAL